MPSSLLVWPPPMNISRRQIGPFEVLPAETKPGSRTFINRVEDILAEHIKLHTTLILPDLAGGRWLGESNNMLWNGGIDCIRLDRLELGHRCSRELLLSNSGRGVTTICVCTGWCTLWSLELKYKALNSQ